MSQSSHFTGARNEAAVKGVVNSDILDPDKLFRYTSGRWLIDEKYQLEQRFVKFNIDRLCSQAASLFSSATKCVRIGKLEGNFNKAFILTMDDGNEVIAKIPCPNSGTPSLMTASEVATLKFLRTRTSIRVPEVYAWSSDPANPVGAEYIIMEKIRGVTLADRWETMSALERYKVVDRIVAMEKDLSSVNFLAYGSLYLRDSVPHDCHHLPLPPNLDPTGQFCIGPSCSRTMLHGSLKDMSQPDVGPWASFLEFALSIPRRELAVIANSKYDVQQQLNHFSESQSVEEYKHLLEKVLQMLPILSHDPRVLEVASSVIWHIDLHLGNIFVSHEDPTIIEGIIDWQSAQAAPLLTQSRFPDFLRPPKDYDSGTEMPSLPDNFDELDPDEREAATRAHALASRSKYYEMSCLAYNKRVYNAMKLDRRIWEPFTCCQLFSNGGLVPLRNSLVRISQDWNSLGLTGNCPFIFTEEELQRHDKQVVEYQDRLYLWDIAKTQLCTDDSGWVPVERWEMTEKMNKDLFDTYVKTMSDELPREVASKNWPFPPNAASPSFG